jgi:hypothetical protein
MLTFSHLGGKILSLNGCAVATAVIIELAEEPRLARPRRDSNPHRSDCPLWH